MPSRPDLRELAANVEQAFAEMDRETLLDILTFVVKEYVVEGPPPMLVHQTETLADLQGLTFAQLIAALQTRLDHPELEQFAVDGDRVSVRVGGVMQPIVPGRGAAAAPAVEQPRPQAGVRVEQPRPQAGVRVEQPRPQAGVRVVETTLAQRPAAPVPAQTSQSAAAGGGPPPAEGQAQPAAPEPADKPEAGDDAAARFSLLELD